MNFSELRRYADIFVGDFLKELPNVFAHTERSEKLTEHSELTLEIFDNIITKGGHFSIIEKLLEQIHSEVKFKKLSLEDFKKEIWCVLSASIYFHDFGKINKKFQQDQLSNHYCFKSFIGFKDSYHSKYGWFFLSYLFTNSLVERKFFKRSLDDVDFQEDTYLLNYLEILLASVVDAHHSNIKNITPEKVQTRLDGIKTSFGSSHDGLVLLNNLTGRNFSLAVYAIEYMLTALNPSPPKIPSLFYLYKLIYSLLITSDYYATWVNADDLKISDLKFNYLERDVVAKIELAFFSTKEYNSELKSKENYFRGVGVSSGININYLRSKMLVEASDNLLNAPKSSRVFYLNAPTGGGKTNISLKLLIDLLKRDVDIRRAYYVFPFINIIEQNHEVIRDTIQPEGEDFVSKVYSYTEWIGASEDKKELLEFYANNEFLNYPIVVISNANFFDSFLKNGKKLNYKIHNFCNSIVILDEIQTLPNYKWAYFSKLIHELAENYNIYFVLMSATLPDISKFLPDKKVINLIENAEKYIQHPSFIRNTFIFEDISDDVKLYICETIARELATNYSTKKAKILCVLNTIKDSQDIYMHAKQYFASNNISVHLLNSTILPYQRQNIIHLFNKKEDQLDSHLLLVSTQSIEAGVDIDCNFGFRELAPLDSIEQVGGRVNREGHMSKDVAKVYIFDNDTVNTVYKKDVRVKIDEFHDKEYRLKILNTKNFEQYYSKVLDKLKTDENKYSTISQELIAPQETLQFEDLSQKGYIEDNNFSIFLPLLVPSTTFSNSELNYLKKFNFLDGQNCISGDWVWRVYTEMNKPDKKDRFLDNKRFQSILNKFIISITNRSIKPDSLFEYFSRNEEFETINGIIKVDTKFLKDFYSVESGLDLRKLMEKLPHLSTCITII